MKSKYDYIIVGQGIAGTLLTRCLQQRGADVLVIDRWNVSSSSNISSGIIHPITGRRKVKTWMADTLIPFAEQFYRKLEADLGVQLYTDTNIIELVDTTKDYNDWLMRSGDTEISEYFGDNGILQQYQNIFSSPQGVVLRHCGWVNARLLIEAFRNRLESNNAVLNESFAHNELHIEADHVTYKKIKAQRIIFCEGWLATKNPFWSQLPFLPAKGELLTVKSKGLQLKHIAVKTIFILPLGNDLYKIGSNYEWKELDEIPTEKIKEELSAKLKQIITFPFEIVKHEAAVRPAIQDRRPVLGFHKEHPNIGIFNGLGTKGALLAPYFADHFSKHLYKGTSLHAEVDVKRFF